VIIYCLFFFQAVCSARCFAAREIASLLLMKPKVLKYDKISLKEKIKEEHVFDQAGTGDVPKCFSLMSFVRVLFVFICTIFVFSYIYFNLNENRDSNISSDQPVGSGNDLLITEAETLTGTIWRFPKKFHRQNLIMVKPGKVGGSTLSGVIRGIGAHYNLNGYDQLGFITKEPGIFAEHREMSTDFLREIESLHKKKFLLTIIRDPAERCLSDFHYFQTHGTQKKQRNFDNIIGYFSRYCTNYHLKYIFDVALQHTKGSIVSLTL